MVSEKIAAGALFPTIELPTVGGGAEVLGEPRPGTDWKLVLVYRGRHCPLCTRYLGELEKRRSDFDALGVDIIAVSADSESQAREQLEAVVVNFPVAYGLSIAQMQELGLYISTPRSAAETDHPFAEPGLFVVNDNGEVQVVDISNGPFVRPELDVLLNGLRFIRNPDNNYPIRGTYQ
jgi:peroxiredoxin